MRENRHPNPFERCAWVGSFCQDPARWHMSRSAPAEMQIHLPSLPFMPSLFLAWLRRPSLLLSMVAALCAHGVAAPASKLSDSGPITVSKDNQVIENLRIKAEKGDAITIKGHSGVVVRNCEIHHFTGAGIAFSKADGLHIQDCFIIDDGAPQSGKNASINQCNIVGEYAKGLVFTNLKLVKGSTGIRVLSCPGAHFSFIEGHDFRGPFPRGQLVQFDKSDDCILEDFSCENPPDTSWPEDIVSVFQSSNATIQRGLVDGNNSTNGVGIMFEQSEGKGKGGLCQDVDAIHQSDGCFSAYPGTDIKFIRTRCRDNFDTDQGRGAPASHALAWAGGPGASGLQIQDSSYFDLAGQQVWERSNFTMIQLASLDFKPRPPIRVSFSWVGQKFEAESLTVLDSNAGTPRISEGAQLSGGACVVFEAKGPGSFITFKVPDVAAGTYDIRVGFKTYSLRGTAQLSIQRADGHSEPKTVGLPLDEYATSEDIQEVDLGSWSAGTNSDKAFKFAITGKNPESKAYWFCVDYIVMKPIQASK